jgi:hypothetical protein
MSIHDVLRVETSVKQEARRAPRHLLRPYGPGIAQRAQLIIRMPVTLLHDAPCGAKEVTLRAAHTLT